MIEFFIFLLHSNELNKEKQKEVQKIKKLFNDDNVTNYLVCEQKNIDTKTFIMCLLILFISILSAKLAYKCMYIKNELFQILITLFAFFFPMIYMLFYITWYLILKNTCK